MNNRGIWCREAEALAFRQSLLFLGLARSTWKGQLSDAGFVQLAFADVDHLLELSLGGPRQRQVETRFLRQFQGDSRILGSVRG